MTVPAVARGVIGQVGPIEYLVLGEGGPVTVFAHGLAGSISEIKPLATPLPGTRVLLHYRGYGGSDPLPDGWDYGLLAEDVLRVADEFGATQACGLSLGAGAILRIVVENRSRFERLGFVMPAILDRPRTEADIERLFALRSAIESGELQQIISVLMEDVPTTHREQRVTQILVARRAAELAKLTPPSPRCVDVPVPDIRALRSVVAPSLILAQRDDPLHTVEIAEQLDQSLPNSTLSVLGHGGVFWSQANETKEALRAHFSPTL